MKNPTPLWTGWIKLAIGGLVVALGGQKAIALAVYPDYVASSLVNTIVGGGITVVGDPMLRPSFDFNTGFIPCALFYDGMASGLSMENGIVLTSGNGRDAAGPNTSYIHPYERLGGNSTGGLHVRNGTPGDADLTALAGHPTFDAAVLTFQFQIGDGTRRGDLFFNYVFGSEEYIEYTGSAKYGSAYDDLIGFFVDGQNIALLPGPGSSPVTAGTVSPIANDAFYRNNVPNINGFPNLELDLSYNGITTVLQAQALGLGPGIHTMKLAIADTGDEDNDSGVFIEAGSFTGQLSVPEPGMLALVGLGGLACLARRRRALNSG